MSVQIIQSDNLDALRVLEQDGARFDLVELDGPYMAGLEGWDVLTEDEYVAHYAARLSIVRRILQPWGVVFVFGYPEGCAEIKAWARQTGTLHLRRWLTWYKQRTAHKGRKVEVVLFFTRDTPTEAAAIAFGKMLKQGREARGWQLATVGMMAGKRWWHRGGFKYFETFGGENRPSIDDYLVLAGIFGFDPEQWASVIDGAYEGLTGIDFLSATYPEDTRDLNDAGLRSKPVGLYHDLFRPVVPPREDRHALILYGGSGNAAIAAGQLGYQVTVIEQDAERCDLIRRRWAWHVEHRDETPTNEYGPLFEVTV